jgi:hypothetical protein
LPLHESESSLRRPTRLVPLCAVLCAVLLAGCGSDDGSGGGGAAVTGTPAATAPRDRAVEALLARAFGERGRSPVSGRLKLGMDVTGRGVGALRGPLALDLGGSFDVSRTGRVPRFDVTSVLRAGGPPVRSGAISTGDAAYVRLKGRTYRLPPELYAAVRDGLAGGDPRAGRPTLQSLGIDPRPWLRDARIAGTDRLDGAPATHVTGRLDVPRLLQDVDGLIGQAAQMGVLLPGGGIQRLSAADRRRIAASVRSSHVDLWVGAADRIVRRMRVGVGLADRSAMDLALDLTEVDDPQRITAPGGARPFADLLSGALGGLLDGRGGKALECLQGSAADPTAAQRCALELLR